MQVATAAVNSNEYRKTMKSPKTLIILAILGTAVGVRAGNELELEQCPANVQETIRTNARGGDVDEVNAITIDDVTLYWAEVDVPERREDLKLLIGSDGKLIKTREEIDLADAPTAVREAAAKLVPAEGELDRRRRSGGHRWEGGLCDRNRSTQCTRLGCLDRRGWHGDQSNRRS